MWGDLCGTVSRVVLNSSACVCSKALSLLLRNRYSVRRWRTLSHRKRMPRNGSFGITPWVVWRRSGLISEKRSGLLVSDRPSLTLVSVHRSRWSFHSQLVPCGCQKFVLMFLDNMLAPVLPIPEPKKTHDWSVEQLADLLRTTHRVKTQQVARSRNQ